MLAVFWPMRSYTFCLLFSGHFEFLFLFFPMFVRSSKHKSSIVWTQFEPLLRPLQRNCRRSIWTMTDSNQISNILFLLFCATRNRINTDSERKIVIVKKIFSTERKMRSGDFQLVSFKSLANYIKATNEKYECFAGRRLITMVDCARCTRRSSNGEMKYINLIWAFKSYQLQFLSVN